MEREQGTRTMRTRRGFLNSAAVAGVGIAGASVAGTFGIGVAEAAGTPAEDSAAILNMATLAETLAVTFYYTVLTGAAFHIDAPAVESLTLTMDAEMRHLQTLRSLGGRSRRQHFYLPDRMLSDASVFVDTGLRVEAAVVGAYLAATHQFAALGQPLLAATAARHAASEAQHLTLLGHLAGLPPRDLAPPALVFQRVSDAALALAPFLAGGGGFGELARFPSAHRYQAARGA